MNRVLSYQKQPFPPNQPPRLLADGMLGTLAKWLRLLGYDTAYDTYLDDHALARWARAEGRLLLTRDHALAARPGLHTLFIEDEKLERQVTQVISQVGPVPPGVLPRCPVCNGELHAIQKELTRERVPPYVYQTQERFHLCQKCDRLYWQGTHWQRIASMLRQWKGKANDDDAQHIGNE